MGDGALCVQAGYPGMELPWSAGDEEGPQDITARWIRTEIGMTTEQRLDS